MSACPHTDNADKCTCGPGCGCPGYDVATGATEQKYTIWLDGSSEGWFPYEFNTLAECFDHMRSYAHGGAYRITKPVNVQIIEVD